MNRRHSTGFTLLELLIVIGVLSILSTVAVLIINPSEMINKAKDSKRVEELASLNKALHIASVQGITSFGSSAIVYVSIPSSQPDCSDLGLPPLSNGWVYHCSDLSNYRKIDGNGWVPINFNDISSGNPLSALPIEQNNSVSSGLYYTYVANSNSWELTATFESNTYTTKYAQTDGGQSLSVWETGSLSKITPWIIANRKTNVWVANYLGNSVTKLDSAGSRIGTYSAGSNPYSAAVDASGNIWIANYLGNSVTKLDSAGNLIGTYLVGSRPVGIAIDASGNVWVANYSGSSVTKLDSAGNPIGTYLVGAFPRGIAADALGNIWITNYSRNLVTKLDSSGNLIGTYPVGSRPYGIAIDASGNVWVANYSGSSVTKLDSLGNLIGTYSAGSTPSGLAVDASGNIWIANYLGNSVTKLDSLGSRIGTYSAGSRPYSLGDMTGFALQYFVLGQR